MAFVIKSIVVLTLAALVTAQYPTKFTKTPKKYQPSQAATQEPLVQLPQYDSYAIVPTQLPSVLPLTFQLPRLENPPVPFYTAEPSAVLKAPENYETQPASNYYEYPVPSQELQVPVEAAWNPENDPKFLYDLAGFKAEEPTNLYPKKYSKDIHEEAKPFSNKLKADLSALEEQDYVNDRQQQKNINKVLLNLAKQENQKRIQAEKVQTTTKNSDKLTASSTTTKTSNNDAATAASGFSSGFDAEGVSHEAPGDGFNQGLDSELKASLGLPYTSPQERLEFQLHGHDGPDSYKWGFDVGKGHDRQFRYEERDHSGYVKGLYGYYDKHGKLQMVNYDSHPHEGFHAEGNFGKF